MNFLKKNHASENLKNLAQKHNRPIKATRLLMPK